MAKPTKDRLGQVLLKNSLITEKELEQARDIQSKEGGSLSIILVRQGIVSEIDLASALARELSIPIINLARYRIEIDSVKLIPEKMARQYRLLPICRLSNTLIVAMADPLNIYAIDDLETYTNFHIEPVISTESEIIQAIDKFYASDKEKLAELVEEEKDEELQVIDKGEELDISEAVLEGETPPIIKMVNLILVEALKKRASDIHIEPEEADVRIRYRVDGNLQEAFRIPKKNQNAILARLKILSGLDITESRLPQDGRFKIKMSDKEVDFRVSVLPTTFGGKVVLRALDKANLSIGLDTLGFSPHSLSRFEDAIAKPFGMILVTGPTGSGKSTTLYSIINQLNKTDKNIITVEDPVEYKIEGITQIQIKPEIGLTFASGLRSLLRQSPDVIMIGEIRDSETADIAVKASLTGQLVLSTLHTNDAASAIGRLIDMGVEPFLIASSIILIVAQRLCRMLCKDCKGEGCKSCNRTGYFGRQAIIEALIIDDKIREIIIEGSGIDEIKKYAQSKGMKILREDAMEKYKKGVMSIEEVERVTAEE